MSETSPIQAVQQAAALVGGVTVLARLVGVSGPAVTQWASGMRRVPAERCPLIERATQGQVRCEILRPDVDWSVLRSPSPLLPSTVAACADGH